MTESRGAIFDGSPIVWSRAAEDPLIWPSARPQALSLPVVALSACGGYYVGSLIGLQLRLPPATTSVLWPPNAILTSLLVLTAPRRWWLVALAAFPAHLFLELGTGWPLPLVLTLFATNCLEAGLAAGCMFVLSDAPWRFDTLRRLNVFVVSSLAAATVSSFADAGAVAWFHGEPYWHVWRARLPSNALAALTVVPAVVGGVHAWIRWWPRRRFSARSAEALVLALGLCAIAWVEFSRSFVRFAPLSALTTQTPLAVQLPFLLWAAVRFGPVGTGLLLLITSLINAWAVIQGHGPFTSIAPATTIAALTLSQLVVAATLLYLATLIEERRATQHELRRRLRFEGLLTRLSAALVEGQSDQMHRAIETWLGPICRVLEIDALTLFSTAHGPDELRPLYSWQSHGDIAQHHLDLARRSLVENVPASPSRVMPLISEEQTLGAIAFECQRDGLGPDLMSNMRLVAEALAGSLGRKRSEDALRASEVMKSAILHSLTSGVAVIDRDGRLLEVNDRWMRLATDCEWMHLPAGGSVIATWRRMYAGGNQLAGLIADGVTAVLDGSRAQFNIEHSTDSGGGVQWWSISAVPLNRTGGGAVITRSDITELRRAEMEAQRSRHELAHVSRVSTIGELTASIAHQLNQPLTAILTNTQVARRLIEAVPVSVEGRLPAVAELRAILHDIESDDRRASDVIARLRTLLRKGGLELTWFNLTAAIQDVVALVGSDAIIREVAISTDFATTPVMMRGDRVQLQQVILNLLQNAMDAMSDQRQRPRAVVIACRHEADDRRVRVTVSDSGPGIEEGLDQTIFEPFYSTKPGGMGIGLSIVRSIIEAHGGSIRAIGGSRGGAVFEFVLPDDGRPPDER